MKSKEKMGSRESVGDDNWWLKILNVVVVFREVVFCQ